jgi:hypothetical protein
MLPSSTYFKSGRVILNGVNEDSHGVSADQTDAEAMSFLHLEVHKTRLTISVATFAAVVVDYRTGGGH